MSGTRDFNNIETRAVINFFFPAWQGAEGNSRHSDRSISLFPSWSAWTYQHPCLAAAITVSPTKKLTCYPGQLPGT